MSKLMLVLIIFDFRCFISALIQHYLKIKLFALCLCVIFAVLLRATAVPAGTAEARISYGNSVCPSVCPSVTTRWYTKRR